jgi:hypothetical protein
VMAEVVVGVAETVPRVGRTHLVAELIERRQGPLAVGATTAVGVPDSSGRT